MTSFVDSQVLAFDDDLQVEARTVLSHAPEPQNAFEVAVILETLGYTNDFAQALGHKDLFAMARRVQEVIEDFGAVRRPVEPRLDDQHAERSTVQLLSLGLLYSIPWITAIIVLLATGSSFWSASFFLPPLASGITLCLFLALVASGGFVQAFTHRATFYHLQARMALVRWTASRILGVGAVTCLALFLGAYFVMERVLAVYTPGTTRSFLELGLAISALQLSFAPLYMMRALWWLIAAVAVGAAVLVIGLGRVTSGLFVSPFDVVDVQLASIASMVAVALVGAWRLLRGGGRDHVAPTAVPQLWATLRTVAPYTLYGSCYFVLIVVDQLVAGGAWRGHFSYDRVYETTVGAALIIVLPLFAYTIAVAETFPARIRHELASLTVAQVETLRHNISAFWARHLVILLCLGVGASAVLLAAMAATGSRLVLARSLEAHLWMLLTALGAYLALAVGMFNAQLLFSLSRPGTPTVAVACGVVVSAFLGLTIGLAWSTQLGALAGLSGGMLAFAGITTAETRRACAHFDTSYYQAL